MRAPTLSILTAVHNIPDNLLRLSLTSSLGQTMRDLELIVVADCTSVSNVETIHEFAAIDDRLRLIVNDVNIGYGRTMNLALANARGKYIGIVDGDDATDLSFYEKLITMSQRSNSSVVKGNVLVMKDGVMLRTLDICEDISKSHYTFSWQHWSAIYKRQFLTENGISWFPDVSKNEETPFLTRVGIHCNYIAVEPTAFYHYTRRGGSLDSEWLSEQKMTDSAKARSKSMEFAILASVFISDEHLAWVLADSFIRTIIESSRAECEEAFEAAARGFIGLTQTADLALTAALPNVSYHKKIVEALPNFDTRNMRDYNYVLAFMKGQNYVPPAIG